MNNLTYAFSCHLDYRDLQLSKAVASRRRAIAIGCSVDTVDLAEYTVFALLDTPLAQDSVNGWDISRAMRKQEEKRARS